MKRDGVAPFGRDVNRLRCSSIEVYQLAGGISRSLKFFEWAVGALRTPIPLPRTHPDSRRYHQYHIVGRHVPTDADPSPQVFRMKLWSLDDTRAKSKFWCVLSHFAFIKTCSPRLGKLAGI